MRLTVRQSSLESIITTLLLHWAFGYNRRFFAILAVFSVLIETASLVTEELKKSKDRMNASLILENWLKKYCLFNSFVQKTCFGPIIFLTLSHIFIKSIQRHYKCVIGGRLWHIKAFRDFIPENLPFIFLLYFRLIIIIAGSIRLKIKV